MENKQLDKLKNICSRYDFEFILDTQKPFFPYKEESPIRKLLMKTYMDLYKKEATIKKIHACMEGGILSDNIRNLDICTIAPNINNCHSVNESVSYTGKIMEMGLVSTN